MTLSWRGCAGAVRDGHRRCTAGFQAAVQEARARVRDVGSVLLYGPCVSGDPREGDGTAPALGPLGLTCSPLEFPCAGRSSL